jgi:transcriptional regulator with XRE-family HTH domain
MDEKKEFSARLRQALQDAGMDLRSPTRIAVQFNLRHHGAPVSTQGVRKWLEGSSIPTQEKIRTLGKWLKVSSEWLRYGDGERQPSERAMRAAEPDEARYADRLIALPDEFARLSPRHKEMVCEIVRALLKTKR